MALAIAFVATSAPSVLRGIVANSFRIGGVNHSSDEYLDGISGVPNATERLNAMLLSVPGAKPIVVAVNLYSSRSTFVGMMTCYLAWPRPVQLVAVRGDDAASELAQIAPDSIGALVMCDDLTRPPWIPHGVGFGRAMELVVLVEEK